MLAILKWEEFYASDCSSCGIACCVALRSSVHF